MDKKNIIADNADYGNSLEQLSLLPALDYNTLYARPRVVVDEVNQGLCFSATGVIFFGEKNYRNFWLTRPLTCTKWTFQTCKDLAIHYKNLIVSKVNSKVRG